MKSFNIICSQIHWIECQVLKWLLGIQPKCASVPQRQTKNCDVRTFVQCSTWYLAGVGIVCASHTERTLCLCSLRCAWGTQLTAQVPLYSDQTLQLQGCHSPESSSSSTVLTRPRTKAQKRQKCGYLLKELSDKVYCLQDKSYMDSVIKKLEDLLEDVGQHTPHDGPLALSYTPPVKRCSEAGEHLRPLKNLQRRLPFCGRVGQKNA